MHLQTQKIVGQNLTFTGTEPVYLGPDLILQNCRVNFSNLTAKKLTLAGVIFDGCEILVMNRMKEIPWYRVSLCNTKIVGTLIGCDFGRWSRIEGIHGSITNCDFSDAVLDACRFFNCTREDVLLPGWPCFCVLNPSVAVKKWSKIDWPGQMAIWAKVVGMCPSETTILVDYAPEVLKKFETSEDQFRTILPSLNLYISQRHNTISTKNTSQ